MGVDRGKGGTHRNRKNVVEKRGYFLWLYYTCNKFSKNNKTIQFSSKLFKLFSIFQQFVFFIQTPEKLTHGLFNFLKICKIMHFSNFHKKVFENFRKFSGVRGGGSAHGPPTRPTPKSVYPEPKSWLLA